MWAAPTPERFKKWEKNVPSLLSNVPFFDGNMMKYKVKYKLFEPAMFYKNENRAQVELLSLLFLQVAIYILADESLAYC